MELLAVLVDHIFKLLYPLRLFCIKASGLKCILLYIKCFLCAVSTNHFKIIFLKTYQLLSEILNLLNSQSSLPLKPHSDSAFIAPAYSKFLEFPQQSNLFGLKISYNLILLGQLWLKSTQS